MLQLQFLLPLLSSLVGIVPFDGCCDFALAFLPLGGRSVGRGLGGAVAVGGNL